MAASLPPTADDTNTGSATLHSTWCCCRQQHISSITTLKELCTVNDFVVHFFFTLVTTTELAERRNNTRKLYRHTHIFCHHWSLRSVSVVSDEFDEMKKKKRARRKKIFRTDETPTEKKTSSLNVKKASIMRVRAFFCAVVLVASCLVGGFFIFYWYTICVQETH